MKTIFLLAFGASLFLFTLSCNNSANDQVEISGAIQEQGMTTYQYGTHTLTNSDSFYAIKSDSLDLNQYLNQEVTLRVQKIEGYPVDGGPEYLLVLDVED